MPSPIRLSSRCTRKKPTVGASTPTIAPAAKASRMNSRSSMHVRRVVPDPGEVRRIAVEDDPLADEDEPLREVPEPHAIERDVHGLPILPLEPPDEAARRAPGFDDLTHRRRRVHADGRPLREVADAFAVSERAGRLAEQSHLAPRRPLEP